MLEMAIACHCLSESLNWRWAMRVNALTSCILLAMAAPFFRVPKATRAAQDRVNHV